MKHKKVGLKIIEILLITSVVIFGIAGIVGAVLVGKEHLGDHISTAVKYIFGLITLGATLPAKMHAGVKDLVFRTSSFVIVDIFFYGSIFLIIILTLLVAKNKRWRAISGLAGMSLGTAALAFFAGLLLPVLDSGYIPSRRNVCPLVGLMLLATLLYVVSVTVVILELSGDILKAVAPEICAQPAKVEEKKEEPVKEEKAEPAPAAEPVKVTVVVEHKNAEPVPAPVVVEEEPAAEVEAPAEEKRVIERVPFEYKILHAEKDLKKKYAELKQYFESYGLKGRISVDGDSYRLHRVLYAQITVAGKKMKVYYKLRTMDFIDSPMPVKDASHVKKYADIPCELDVKSDLSVKRAKELMDRVMAEAGIEKIEK